MTDAEYYELRQKVSTWLRIKAQHEKLWTDKDRSMLIQLAADVDHSGEGKAYKYMKMREKQNVR